MDKAGLWGAAHQYFPILTLFVYQFSMDQAPPFNICLLVMDNMRRVLSVH